MKSLIKIVLLALCCLALTGCDILFDYLLDGGHSCTFSPWDTVEEPTCSEYGEEERYCYECYETETRRINKKAHTPVDFEGEAADCTEGGKTAGQYCSECMVILSGIKDTPPTGHTEVIDPAVEATETTPGRTEGKHCSVCNQVLVKQTSVFYGDFSDPDRYHGDYAYESLGWLENGEQMMEFYEEIDQFASEFHDSVIDAQYKDSGESGLYYVAEIYFSDNGLSGEEALSVWAAYLIDHPIYYWLSGNTTYTSMYFTLTVDEEYADGEVREDINQQLYECIEEYITALDGVDDIYYLTLGFHDLIIDNASYAYEDDGVTPSADTEHHNALGVLLYGAGVCESYAKSFQLLLNYCKVDNVYVTGYAGEPHAWNMVKLDNDGWYWYDLTWDDAGDWMLGVRHNYFCVTDDQLVNWNDGSTSKSTSFLQDHSPSSPGSLGVNYAYDLPERADEPYVREDIMLRDQIIEIDGLSYVLIGYNAVSLIKIEAEGDIEIPESINFNGASYRVRMIGKYDETNKILRTGSIIDYNSSTREHLDVTSVSIPSGVDHIWDFAFDHCYTIESFSVSESNKSFVSQNGVLFTKSLYTLVKYPLAKADSEYNVPSETVEIAYGSFGDGGNVFCPQNLEELVINVEDNTVIGATGGGYGFRDRAPTNPDRVTSLSGYFTHLFSMLGLGFITK